MKRPTIGLALGSGGARGFAHIGVIKALEEANIPIDYIAGSSMGALVGSLYGSGHSVEVLRKFATMFKRKYFVDMIVPKMGLLAGNKIKQLVYLLTKGKNIEELSPKVAIVATDLLKGERVIFEKGSVAEAVRASISIPGIFVPEKVEDRLLVDGGVVDPLPIFVVKEMGADITIAVDVSQFQSETEVTTIYDVIMLSMGIMGRKLGSYQQPKADFSIRPIMKVHSPLSFSQADELINQGEQATKKQLPLIKEKLLTWKG